MRVDLCNCMHGLDVVSVNAGELYYTTTAMRLYRMLESDCAVTFFVRRDLLSVLDVDLDH